MSNLSELLPAGAGAKSADFVASGTLSSGQVVILNANGQVGAVSGSGAVTGSETVFEAATTRYVSSAYDTTTDRVVIAYADGGNSYHGTAIVGTVSGTTISFGTAVVFETAEVQDVALTFDNNSNKIVIAYADEGNSSHGTAIVGTVSGTSISFGSAVVFAASNIDDIANTFDSNSNKVVIAYSNLDNSYYGTAIVGTVSGTSISFGTAVVFGSSNISNLQLAFDPNSNKVVIAYRDITNSQYGYAIIGTVSGTAISFGTAVVVLADASKDFNTPVIDSTNNKVIISYANGGNSSKAEARVGTISGTSISFGTAVVFSSGTADFYTGGAYHAGLQKVVLAYRDDTSGTLTGKYNVGTVSGTDISFSGEVIFNSGRADNISLVYDPDSTNLVNSFEDNANSSYGTSQVFSPSTLNLTSTNFIGITDAAIADTATGAVIVKGGVSANVTGLTIGSDYYVQDDGSIRSPTGAYPYNISGGVYNSVSLVVSDNLMSIFFKPDGTKLYAIGYTNDTVYEYGLSTAFDLSTATLNGNTKSIAAQSGVTPSLVFKTDGTKMYALSSADEVFQYSLSTAWDVSSASYDSKSLTVSSQDSNSSGIWFKSDGTEMYMCGFTNDSIFQYDLATPWDVSTGAYASISFNMSATSTQPRNMYFNSTGTILFLADTANPDKVFKFVLSTAWDITTISFSSSLDVSAQAAKAVDVVLNADGTKMYVADSENTNTIYQYALNGSTSSVPAGRALSTTSILLEG
jgi:hypothetical protein